MNGARLALSTLVAAGRLAVCTVAHAVMRRLASFRHRHDPVWQAFEKTPPPHRPLNAKQLAKRERGLREMREGKLVDIDASIRLGRAVPLDLRRLS